MEGVDGTHKASKLAAEDVISSMPDNVITNVMNRLPIRDAVRTSILATNWRLKWTLLTQLEFNMSDSGNFRVLGPESREYYDSKIMSRILLHLEGPVTKFVLIIEKGKMFDVEDLNHWLLFMSKKGIKEFNLINMPLTPLRLRTHLFTCQELTHLKLHNCWFHLPPTFSGFPNLLSLDLCLALSESGNFGEFFTRCPLLETLKLNYVYGMKLADIAKLENLKALTLSLCKLDNKAITSFSVFQLGGYLPKLQELCLDCQYCRFLGETSARKWVRSAFPCLKTLTLSGLNFSSDAVLSFSIEMIQGSPNLQSLDIKARYENDFPPAAYFSSDVDNNTMEQLQLRNVMFSSFKCSENELCLIKFLLACSPILKKIIIHFDASKVFGGDKGKLMFSAKLLELPRASPIAQVKLCRF